MKGLFTRATVHAAALLAVEHWRAEFERKKEECIAKIAAQPRGIFDRRPKGTDMAELQFGDSLFNGGEGDGWLWYEHEAMRAAERLVRLTDRVEPPTVILTGDEIAVLRPVLAMAPLAEGMAPA